jgi:small redox-active disulfide protein 2
MLWFESIFGIGEINLGRKILTQWRSFMKVKILGAGCLRCKKLYAEAEKAIVASGVKADLEKIEKIEEIIKYGIMATPGLVIDEEVKASGRIPQSNEIVIWLKTAAKSVD